MASRRRRHLRPRTRQMNEEQEKIVAIRPSKGWFDIDWREIFGAGELIALFVRRDVTIIYKQTILGPLWFFLQPVITAMIFSVIFGRVASIPTDGMPKLLFYMSGLLSWNYFRSVLEASSQSFQNAQHIFSKVYFPRFAVPISTVFSNLVFFGLNLAVFLLFYLHHAISGESQISPTWHLLALPLLLLWIAAAALGFGLVVAALTTKYRDLRFAMPFILQCWMYATPVIYPLSGVRDPFFKAVLLFNPLSAATEALRFMLMGRGTVTYPDLLAGAAVIVLALVAGFGAFNRVQRNFVDTI